jgi:predicted nuclease of restriction endonuclease-like (RecB) superfamily
MLFERTAISKKPEETINDLKKLRVEKEMSINLFLKDPYMLDFLGLKDTFNESDLEAAILVDYKNLY